MLTWIKITINAEIELVESLYAIFYQYGYVHSTITQVFQRHQHDWFSMVTYMPRDDQTADRKDKLERALWHLEAFDLISMDQPQYDAVTMDELGPDGLDDGIYWVTPAIGIKLSYEHYVPDDDQKIVVTLKPGTAFGSGYHPTTRLSIRALERHVKPHMSVLDIGTGTGILAFIAARMGGMDIEAVDIDRSAVAFARENAELNQCPAVRIAHASAADVTSSYDFVVANMPASILTRNAPFILQAVNPGGTLVLSGMTSAQADGVSQLFSGYSLEKIDEMSDNDWIAYIYKKTKTDTERRAERGDI